MPSAPAPIILAPIAANGVKQRAIPPIVLNTLVIILAVLLSVPVADKILDVNDIAPETISPTPSA